MREERCKGQEEQEKVCKAAKLFKSFTLLSPLTLLTLLIQPSREAREPEVLEREAPRAVNETQSPTVRPGKDFQKNNNSRAKMALTRKQKEI